MIAIFSNPNDSELISWVKCAVRLIEYPEDKIQVVPLDRRGLKARGYVATIREMDACIIDIDQEDLLGYAVEFGSLGDSLTYWVSEEDTRLMPKHSILDSRLMLVTRQPLQNHRLIQKFCGDFYSKISLEGGINDELTIGLASWLKDTIESAVPKVFISYRSSQQEFARRVAKSLNRRGAAVWFDKISISPGDSIPEAINRGLAWCTHLILIIDEYFFDSRWTQAEVESILYRHLSGERYSRFRMQANPRPLIPMFLVDPNSHSMPEMLRRIRGIDCRLQSFSKSMNQLWAAVTSVGPR